MSFAFQIRNISLTGFFGSIGTIPFMNRVSRVLLTSAGPRVAEAIFAHVTSAASTVALTGVGRRFEDRRLVVGLLEFVSL